MLQKVPSINDSENMRNQLKSEVRQGQVADLQNISIVQLPFLACSSSSIKTLVCQNVCKCQLVHFDPEKPNLDFLWCKYSVEYILYKADFNS